MSTPDSNYIGIYSHGKKILRLYWMSDGNIRMVRTTSTWTDGSGEAYPENHDAITTNTSDFGKLRDFLKRRYRKKSKPDGIQTEITVEP